LAMMFTGILSPREGGQRTAVACPLVLNCEDKEDSSDEDMEAMD
jgi:hypothetical protein